jgi:hypothetical protein
VKILECTNFHEVISKRQKSLPQAIVAGWFNPNGEPLGAAATVADNTPTEGQMAVAWACCLAACFKKLDELLQANPEHREQLMALVKMMTEGLDVVDRFKSDLVSVKALAGCQDSD